MNKTLVEKFLPVIQIIPFWMIAVASATFANPFPDPDAVPRDQHPKQKSRNASYTALTAEKISEKAREVLRVDVDWQKPTDRFTIASARLESSGTEALYANAHRSDPHGSYRAEIINRLSGEPLYYSSIGTGQEFRKLTRALTFRFPVPTVSVNFTLIAEHPVLGNMEEVLNVPLNNITPANDRLSELIATGALEVFNAKSSDAATKVILNVYAEGYRAENKAAFVQRVHYLVGALRDNHFPGFEYFEINGVFSPSNLALGYPRDMGSNVEVRDSHLGLYFPYWHKFGRWGDVVYPTSEKKFRDNVGLVPYDYALALIDSDSYWGVGNFKELTAIPARHSSFTYLLLHEIGHFFGLNEEYSGGGPTELRFAPETKEPWSQNITFATSRAAIKWYEHILPSTEIPTPSSVWEDTANGPWGAYRGGYASSDPYDRSKIPGFSCTMSSGRSFCPICREAIAQRVKFDMGL